MKPWLSFAAAGSLLLGACSLTSRADAPPTRLPNPAVAKCRADGWRTEPVLTHGVPTGTVCTDPRTGRRCEAWAYFRGECPSGSGAPPPKEATESTPPHP